MYSKCDFYQNSDELLWHKLQLLGALEQVLKCGCSVLATVHGGSYEELSRKRFLQPLLQAGAFQRYLVLKHCDGTFFVEQVRDGDGQLLASGLACCA